MKAFIRVMKALSDPNRVKIIKMLERKELCVCEITALLGLAQSTVSRHLKQLEDAELVTSSRNGPWVDYRLAGAPASPYAAFLGEGLKEWLNDDPDIRAILEQLPKIERERICAA